MSSYGTDHNLGDGSPYQEGIVRMKASGYAHPGYAESLAEFGIPRALPESGGTFLERRIPGTLYRDAMGCYPLFACRDWSRLLLDLEEFGAGLVSFSAVSDPFGDYDLAYLRRCFQDVVIPFKEHFVTDLSLPKDTILSKHHRYYALRALEKVCVEECPEPSRFTEEWVNLYANLVERHDLKGIKAFSKEAFARQLEVPGLVMLRARAGEETVGMHLWYLQGEVAYSHLAASTPLGYELLAAYALYAYAIDQFADRVRWLDLGAGAGVGESADGLSKFKKGWSTGSRTAYFCGRVFDPAKYSELSRQSGNPDTGYFPVYRQGEFG